MTTITHQNPAILLNDQPQAIAAAQAGKPRSALFLGILLACSSLVFIEPAPYDILVIVGFVALLIMGLRIPRALNSAAILLGLFIAGNTMAALTTPDPLQTIRSLSIRSYMPLAWLLLASLLLSDPARMFRALWTGYLIASIIAAIWGGLEYFGFIASDLWQGGLRAKGPFKDPNVLGPFLVPPAVFCLASIAGGGPRKLAIFGSLFLLLTFGILLSFSRGAWINFALSTALFSLLCFVFSPSLRARLQWMLAGTLALMLMVAALSVAVSFEPIGKRFFQRAVLAQKYDTATGGRFASQQAAIDRIARDPIGVGPGRSDEEFGLEPHNLYLHTFVEGGWLAGGAFLSFILLTGMRMTAALRQRYALLHPELLVTYACLTGVLFQSLFIDSTHWRHLWLLLAMAWALVIACHRSQFEESSKPLMSKR